MVRRLTSVLNRYSITALAVVVGGTGLGIPALAGDEPSGQSSKQVSEQASMAQTEAEPSGHRSCLLVDTDVGLDDFRALATLLPQRRPRAVVVTEGIAGVRKGSTAVSMFMASRSDTAPVIPGLASATPPPYDWLPVARAGAERINNYLHAAVPFKGSTDRLVHDVLSSVRDCSRVDVLVLGPWTSYNKYAPYLGSRAHVVASGRPFAENNPDNFNCEYDLPACRKAVDVLERARSAVFVDLPAPGDPLTYDPTEAWVARFETSGMPGLLRTALQVDPSQWLGTRLWDDAAGLYLLAPGKFTRRGKHLEPAVPEDVFRNLLVAAVNHG
jgi:hypothetical protein